MHSVDVPRRPVAALEDVIGLPRTTRLVAAAADFRKASGGRVVWNFSSTATGGGVADMLQVLVGYTKDLAIDVRWMVIDGDGSSGSPSACTTGSMASRATAAHSGRRSTTISAR